ncbi:MAG: glycosyltransferase family 39 protein [Planctomycetes bacterium]|nr:glycosyltransferase family 39 protein [Planctomycetota bacterium]
MSPGTASSKRHAAVIASFALAVVLVCTLVSSQTALWDRDEPRFARAAVEMVESGQYLYPTFNERLRADKPILVYWLMSLPIRAFGASEWSVRLWSAVGLALASCATFAIGRKLFGARVGLLAALILVTTPLAFAESVLATTDALLLGLVTSALAFCVHAVVDGTRIGHLLGFAAAIAAALLLKGPIGLALPVLAIGAALFLGSTVAELRPWRRFLPVAAFTGLAVFLLWAVPANVATDGEFARQGLGHHVLDRVTTAQESHGGAYFAGLPFYVPIVWIGFGAWSLYLPAALMALWASEGFAKRERALLLGWLATTFVLVTLVATKLVHYVLPLFPALALIAARVVDAADGERLGRRTRKWLPRGAWVFVPLVAIELGALTWLGWREPSVRVGAGGLAVLALATAGFALARFRRGEHYAAAGVLAAGSFASASVLVLGVLRPIDARKPVPPLAAELRAAVEPGVRLATYDFDEPSLLFYVGRGPIKKLSESASARAWLLAHRPVVLVTTPHGAGELATTLAELGGREIARSAGFNFATGREVELVALAFGQR